MLSVRLEHLRRTVEPCKSGDEILVSPLVCSVSSHIEAPEEHADGLAKAPHALVGDLEFLVVLGVVCELP